MALLTAIVPASHPGLVRADTGNHTIDRLVEDVVIVELKGVERLMPIHEAQLLSYLKLSGQKVGLLINFNL